MLDQLDPRIVQELFHNLHQRPGDVFADVLKRDGHIIAGGIHNAFGARAVRDNYLKRTTAQLPCEFNAVYLGGWSVSAMLLQRPDMGFLDRSTMVLVGRYAIPAAFPLPVIVDAETGFGPETVDIADTVREYHAIGVGLAHLEDQGSRRCGNLVGKFCLPTEDFITKIKTWLLVSEELGSSMRLMVRTDALTAAGGGLDDAIDRMKRYMDVEYQGRRPLVSWADALIDKHHIEKWARELLKHDPAMVLGINYSPNKDWTKHYRDKHQSPPPSYGDLLAMGFRVIWHTTIQARADMGAGLDVFEQQAIHGAKALHDLHERFRGLPAGDPQGLSNARQWQALDKFVGGQATQERYEKSEGYGKI